MQLPNLHKTVILIDTEFLIKTIKNCYSFYSRLYPEKEFKTIDISDIFKSIVSSSRLSTSDEQFSVIFLYKLDNDVIPYMKKPNCISLFNDFTNRPLYMNDADENSKYHLYSFFADPEAFSEYEYNNEFCMLLEGVTYNKNTFNVCLVADNYDLNPTLDSISSRLDKSLFIFRSTDSRIEVGLSPSDGPLKFNFVNFDYIIGLCMGLEYSEL